MSSKWVNQIVDCVFGNDKLCCFCPRPESTFWTTTQNASTQNGSTRLLILYLEMTNFVVSVQGPNQHSGR